MWHKLKYQLWQWRGILVAAPSVATLVLILRFTGLLQMLELAGLDQMFLLRPDEGIDSRIVIVTINEPEAQILGKRRQWPLPDHILAKLLANIKQQKPSAIGLDLYRDFPVGTGEEDLAKIFTSTPNLIGVQKVGENLDSSGVAPNLVLKKLDQIGANDFPLDGDGKIRRSLIYLSDKNQENVFSFGFKLANFYLQDKNIEVGQTKDFLVKTGNIILPLFQGNDGGYVRAEDQGYQLLLNYRGSINSFLHISVLDVLENRIPQNLLKGKIVLIGSTAESLKDIFYTPYSSTVLTLPKRMAGVTIHANLISQILSAALENRPLIKTWHKSLEWLWIFIWSLIGATLIWQQRYIGTSVDKIMVRLVTVLLAGSTLLITAYFAFLAGWWIPVVPALITLIGSVFGATIYIAQSADEIRKTFGRYLTNEIVATLLENPEGLKMGGERRKITMLTSDLRGFTATSARLPAEDVINIINLYLGYMADVITKYQGTIDEFMGDGILVLFGAPISREDDATRAVACAVAMQLAMTSVNEKLQQMQLPKLEMGIGINTNEVVVGNIGSETRTKYGVIGSEVNLTYRIESYTMGGQILVSQSTIEAVGEAHIGKQMEVHPKGLMHPINIYEVNGISGNYNLFLSQQEEEEFLNLSTPIPLSYAIVDGKDISSMVIEGKLVKLSDKCGQVYIESKANSEVLSPFTNIKINFIMDIDGAMSDDIYAKVLEKESEANSFYIQFTNLAPEIKSKLNNLPK